MSATAGGTAAKPTLTGMVALDGRDTGKEFWVWAAALHQGGLYFRRSRGWALYQGNGTPDPVAWHTAQFASPSISTSILDGSLDTTGLAGTDIYLGVGASFNEMIAAQRYAKVYTLGTAPVVPDTSPDPFSFVARTGVAAGALVESDTITVSGINAATPIRVGTAEYRIYDGAWTKADGTVNAGDRVTLRGQASRTAGEGVSYALVIGDQRAEFDITTARAATAVDQPPVMLTPTATVTANSVTLVDASSDADGLRNRVYSLYPDSTCTGTPTSNSSGVFTGLAAATAYCYKISFEVMNGATGAWTATGWNNGVVTTASATPGTATDSPPDLRAPTVTVTSSSIAIVNMSTDADGFATGDFNLYANTDHTGLLATNTTGVFTGLTAGTAYGFTYYFIYRNRETGVWISSSYSGTATTAAASGGSDTTPPAAPTLTSTPQYTNQNSVTVEVNGEAGAAVWVNGLASGLALDASGKTSLALDTAGADGVKSFALTLKDAAGNASGALALSIEKGTVAPGNVAFVTIAPDTQGAGYNNIIFSGDKSFTGAKISVTSRNGGTVIGVSINGSGEIVFDYTSPFANPDYLDIAGTDKYGNAIAIALRVDLPN